MELDVVLVASGADDDVVAGELEELPLVVRADPVGEPSAVDVAAVDVAGAVVVGEDGVDDVVSCCEDAFASSPMVVVPEVWPWPTSAETGSWLISSTPVTIPMAIPKTASA